MTTGTIPAVIGFPCESTPKDRRTLLTPVIAGVLSDAGFTVIAEPGVGTGLGCPDSVLQAEGVCFADPDEVWSAPLVFALQVR